MENKDRKPLQNVSDIFLDFLTLITHLPTSDCDRRPLAVEEKIIWTDSQKTVPQELIFWGQSF